MSAEACSLPSHCSYLLAFYHSEATWGAGRFKSLVSGTDAVWGLPEVHSCGDRLFSKPFPPYLVAVVTMWKQVPVKCLA